MEPFIGVTIEGRLYFKESAIRGFITINQVHLDDVNASMLRYLRYDSFAFVRSMFIDRWIKLSGEKNKAYKDNKKKGYKEIDVNVNVENDVPNLILKWCKDICNEYYVFNAYIQIVEYNHNGIYNMYDFDDVKKLFSHVISSCDDNDVLVECLTENLAKEVVNQYLYFMSFSTIKRAVLKNYGYCISIPIRINGYMKMKNTKLEDVRYNKSTYVCPIKHFSDLSVSDLAKVFLNYYNVENDPDNDYDEDDYRIQKGVEVRRKERADNRERDSKSNKNKKDRNN